MVSELEKQANMEQKLLSCYSRLDENEVKHFVQTLLRQAQNDEGKFHKLEIYNKIESDKIFSEWYNYQHVKKEMDYAIELYSEVLNVLKNINHCRQIRRNQTHVKKFRSLSV